MTLLKSMKLKSLFPLFFMKPGSCMQTVIWFAKQWLEANAWQSEGELKFSSIPLNIRKFKPMDKKELLSASTLVLSWHGYCFLTPTVVTSNQQSCVLMVCLVNCLTGSGCFIRKFRQTYRAPTLIIFNKENYFY